MAVTFFSGPMDWRRDGQRTRTMKTTQRNPCKESPLPPDSSKHVRRGPSNLTKISHQLKYVSYVMVEYVAGGQPESPAEACSPTQEVKRSNSFKALSLPTGLTIIAARDDPFGKGETLYPVTRDGRLREVYVRELIARVNEEGRNRERGWDRGLIGLWFGRHLHRQINAGATRRDYQAHFLAAVALHRRMSTDSRVPRPKGKVGSIEELWRDVVDELNGDIALSSASIKHDAGTDSVTLERFMENFARLVGLDKWDKIGLAMFPGKGVDNWWSRP